MLNRLARTKIGPKNSFAFNLFQLGRFSPEPAGGQNRPPSESKHKRHHGRFPASPNMAQTPFRSSAVPLRCFPPVVDLTDAFFACIPPRQRKNFAAARLLDAGGVLEANNDAHGRHGVPVARPTTVNAGAYPGTTETVLLHAGPPTVGTMRHCAIYRVEMSRSPCDRRLQEWP